LPPWPSGGGIHDRREYIILPKHSKPTLTIDCTVEAVAPTKLYTMRREEPRSCKQDPQPACSVRRSNKRFAGDNFYRSGCNQYPATKAKNPLKFPPSHFKFFTDYPAYALRNFSAN